MSTGAGRRVRGPELAVPQGFCAERIDWSRSGKPGAPGQLGWAICFEGARASAAPEARSRLPENFDSDIGRGRDPSEPGQRQPGIGRHPSEQPPR